MRILGIDPGLQKTGWGVIEAVDNRLSFITCGLIKTDSDLTLAERLCQIDVGMQEVISAMKPDEAAIEETFMNNNAASALKLGCARGVAMVVPARFGISVSEYAANLVKKSVVGTGHATKDQVEMMVRTLIPTYGKTLGADEADALAIAICHAHHATTRNRFGAIMAGLSA
ncbi:MAG: crossover junction endodeoxyribonuclease RuvC [Micavibrio aeruginosavorus]|uniref:Crossover junction endodeoxyribonuclease RuvC n=1 Tax=Micavibrio aeruginosavorus TaxID=349221 RepID=A0A2W5BJ74_9BACT|nr:MAG: crossover junction endodeoxyribonuclease RuvC [Micavibrio aeruginosavorus]